MGIAICQTSVLTQLLEHASMNMLEYCLGKFSVHDKISIDPSCFETSRCAPPSARTILFSVCAEGRAQRAVSKHDRKTKSISSEQTEILSCIEKNCRMFNEYSPYHSLANKSA